MSSKYFDSANGERYIKQSWVIQQIKEEKRHEQRNLNNKDYIKALDWLLERLGE